MKEALAPLRSVPLRRTRPRANCAHYREAISARIDREDAGTPDGAIEQHLTACDACRAFLDNAVELRRQLRFSVAHESCSVIIVTSVG